jgi:CheY-like chemotaxis protein
MHSVMVVDDDEDIRALLQELLEDDGYRVVSAEHGAVALDALRAGERPCLMLVDLLMPVMDGIELIEQVRGDEKLAQIPVVVVSAASAVDPPQGTPILRKPVSSDVILDAVHRVCGPASPPC